MSQTLSAQTQALTQRYFDSSFYLTSNSDVATAVGAGRIAPFQHFANFGAKENRSPFLAFNSTAYLANNADVANAVGSGRIHSAWDHFVTFGVLEGRSGGGTPAFAGGFNSAAYLAANSDVAAAVANGSLRSGYEHFLLFGANEGRAAFNAAGQSFFAPLTRSLTVNQETINGSGGDDLFLATVGGPLPTLGGGDIINGGAGIDTLRVTVLSALSGEVLQGAIVNGVERLEIQNLDLNVIVDVSAFQSVTTTGAATFNNAPSGFTVNVGPTSNALTTANYVPAATISNIAISNGTGTAGFFPGVKLGGVGLTTANITSTGAANVIPGAIDVASATTVNLNATTNLTLGTFTGGVPNLIGIETAATAASLIIAGAAASVNLGILDNGFTVVNAGGLTGGLTATLSNSQTAVVTGGRGADIITTGAILTTGSMDAGAGDAVDRLIVTNSAHISATVGPKYVGFEQLQVQNGVSVDLDHLPGITGIRINDGLGSTGVLNLSAPQAANITLLAVNDVFSIGLKNSGGTFDVVGLNIQQAVPGPVVLSGLLMSGVETLNITTNAAASTVTLNASALAGLTTVGLIGPAGVNITTGGSTTIATINASQAGAALLDASLNSRTVTLTGGNGSDTLIGSGLADTLVGNDGGDTLTGNAGGDTLTGGAGSDVFRYPLRSDSVVTPANNGFDIITSFEAGVDKFMFGVAVAGVQSTRFGSPGAGDLNTQLGAVIGTDGAGILANNAVVVVLQSGAFAGNYLVVNDGNAGYQGGTDTVIQIIGSVPSLGLSDFSLFS